jgi:hypothetical protein
MSQAAREAFPMVISVASVYLKYEVTANPESVDCSVSSCMLHTFSTRCSAGCGANGFAGVKLDICDLIRELYDVGRRTSWQVAL